MKVEVHFRHMKRSESLESYALEKIESVVEEFLNREDCHLQIWLDDEHDIALKGKPAFKCEVDLRYPKKKEIFLSETFEDMHQAIEKVAKKLQTVLRDSSKKEIRNKRHT